VTPVSPLLAQAWYLSRAAWAPRPAPEVLKITWLYGFAAGFSHDV